MWYKTFLHIFNLNVKLLLEYVFNILLYNAQLTQLNQQINNVATTFGPNIQTITTTKGSKKTLLSNNHTDLLAQKTHLKTTLS